MIAIGALAFAGIYFKKKGSKEGAATVVPVGSLNNKIEVKPENKGGITQEESKLQDQGKTVIIKNGHISINQTSG